MRSGRPSMQLFVQLARLNTAEWIATIDSAAEGADVIVATTLVVYHAASVAQERGIPLVFGQLQPTLATRDYAPPMLGVTGVPPWLNRTLATAMQRVGDVSYRGAIKGARRALGQSALRLVWEELPILAAWSPTLVPASPDWDHPNVTITGPWLRHPERDWTPPAELTEFLDAGEPDPCSVLTTEYRVLPEKARILTGIAELQRPYLNQDPRAVSIYVGKKIWRVTRESLQLGAQPTAAVIAKQDDPRTGAS